MNKLRLLITLTIISLTVTFSACKKSKLNRETTTSEDNSIGEAAFEDVYNVVIESAADSDIEGDGKTAASYYIGTCAIATIDPAWPDNTFPKTITIDFGDGCIGRDGRTRKGIIEVFMTDRYRNPGSLLVTTPVGYEVDGYQVFGKKTVNNGGRNFNGHLFYDINVTDGHIITPDGDEISWESSRTRQWIEGEETNFLSNGISGVTDDVYLITGLSTGVNRAGRDFTAEITSALRIQVGCRWVTAGTFEIRPDDLRTRKVDYGDGTCDNEANVEIGNRDYDIRLR